MATVFKIKRKGGVRYGVDYYLPDGNRKKKIIGPKWYEADEYRKQIETAIREDRLGVLIAKEITFSKFAEQYLSYNKTQTTAKTFSTNYYYIDRILVPFFGRHYLHRLDIQLIDQFMTESLKRGVSPLTVNGYLRILSAMLNKAVEWQYRARNVVAGIKRLKAPEKEARFLTHNEAARLLEAVRYTRLWVTVSTGLFSGLRKGELLNLKWPDINFDLNYIRVINRPEEGFQTKNYRNRTVGLHPELKKVLLWWRKTSATRVRHHKSQSEYVVTYQGEPVSSVERALKTAYLRAELSSERPFHTLRHSFGGFLAMAGVGLYEIAKIMGHTYEDVTKLYAHLQPEHLLRQVEKIPPIMLRPRSQNVPKAKEDPSKPVEIIRVRKERRESRNRTQVLDSSDETDEIYTGFPSWTSRVRSPSPAPKFSMGYTSSV
jgi:integrase